MGVVLDLAKNLDTFSVAGRKLTSQLSPSLDSTKSPSPKTPVKTSALSSPARSSSSPRKGRTSPIPPIRASPSALISPRASPSAQHSFKSRTSSLKSSQSQPSSASPPSKMTPSAPNPVPPISSPPSTISNVSVRPLSSPPGFPTPRFVNQHPNSQPVCLSVKSCSLLRSPLSTNLEYFDETFGGADKMTSREEEQFLRNHFYDAEFKEKQNGNFIMRTKLGLRYWSGHGEYKCTPHCYNMVMGQRGFQTIVAFTSNGSSRKDSNLVDKAVKEPFVHVCDFYCDF